MKTKDYIFFALCIAIVVLAMLAFVINDLWPYIPAGLLGVIVLCFIFTDKCAGNE